ncbi:outer membrane beta-barrel protein [Niveibacterium umoris]|uniref:OOP family OmpA-OmpF porin n=1 Tax=Niveibacterium umoris TaxID=1193620 RepID=A0A840BTR9_9RHOO|nr:porin family protein [Niveibacterium umoris]MBB4014206.1 OOP family OmpA-OmpF porin [Niveibacterium umoris]
MKTQLLIAAAAATFAGSALAADEGFYIGGNVGASKHDVSGVADVKDNPTTWGLYGGYDFNRNFAVELGYQDLGKAEAGGYQSKNYAVSTDLVGKLPVSDRFDVFGKVGLAYVDRKVEGYGTEDSQSGTAAKLGLGAEFKATQNVGIRAEVAHYMGAPKIETATASFDKNTTVFTMGVNYKF